MTKTKRPKLPPLKVICDHPGTGEYWCKKGTCAYRAAQVLLDQGIQKDIEITKLKHENERLKAHLKGNA